MAGSNEEHTQGHSHTHGLSTGFHVDPNERLLFIGSRSDRVENDDEKTTCERNTFKIGPNSKKC